jgi:hypothetical protein
MTPKQKGGDKESDEYVKKTIGLILLIGAWDALYLAAISFSSN